MESTTSTKPWPRAADKLLLASGLWLHVPHLAILLCGYTFAGGALFSCFTAAAPAAVVVFVNGLATPSMPPVACLLQHSFPTLKFALLSRQIKDLRSESEMNCCALSLCLLCCRLVCIPVYFWLASAATSEYITCFLSSQFLLLFVHTPPLYPHHRRGS